MSYSRRWRAAFRSSADDAADTPTTSEQAVALIRTLAADPALRERIGRAARRTVEEIYGGSTWKSKIAFFVSRERRASGVEPAAAPTPSELY